MNKMSNFEVGLAVISVIILVYVGVTLGHFGGYKAGQRDALMGKYMYSLETNSVVDVKINK